MDTIIRAIVIIFAIYTGVWAFREMRSGIWRIQEDDEPAILIKRQERPFAYWSFTVGFYATLSVIIAVAALVPFDG